MSLFNGEKVELELEFLSRVFNAEIVEELRTTDWVFINDTTIN